MYEHRTAQLLSRRLFWRRMLRHGGAALGALAVSLVAGTIGYHMLGHLEWDDAFLNASMILGGMGPVGETKPFLAGKLFAAFYALYSGVFFLLIAGVLFAPAFHRMLHRFHLEQADRKK